MSATDPRPLTGEPFSLDLLNTRWHDRHGSHDLLCSVTGLALWLARSRAAESYGRGELRADRATLAAARAARSVLAGVVGRPAAGPAALDAFNRLLEAGRTRRLLTEAGPVERLEIADPAGLLGYLAAADYLRLLAAAPDRVRRCADPSCGLRFHDVSRNGTRRWCTSTGCGNRAKAARHYARRTAGGPAAPSAPAGVAGPVDPGGPARPTAGRTERSPV
ncbi:CGNR zinc finger domain-containing protein [Streptomyces sp. NPDC006544]|uniref:CGNR zinc finger domain-containing protein n=1 Tax=Streptomyces sp. NPDC006544 TaxID=3154583 RepID=UPI0033A5577C